MAGHGRQKNCGPENEEQTEGEWIGERSIAVRYWSIRIDALRVNRSAIARSTIFGGAACICHLVLFY